ncbi:ankyrin repeat-containing domain protein [Parachaetomium inaequale]|uniref:Ankyrin repeat-containing domain protein n=1 Tax=Parachaetomium inaequale TaxID=2588326 RepID=A0AAN6SR08_9PEZI|nr:ankyrin repeat-containing domain protein [Parachaetomium inaequale]
MPTPAESQLDWAAHRSKIEDLYWNHAKELPEVMKTMAEVYGFVATQKSYKRKFKAWGLKKNHNKDESIAMLRIAEKRRMENKETDFIRRGKPVELAKLRRFARRHKLTPERAASTLDEPVTTPPHITYKTPEPDTSNNSLPPAPLPHPDPETSEGEQATTGGSPGSYGLDSDGSPQSSNFPWVPPIPFSWACDETHSDSRPGHINLAAHFIPDAFSGHQIPHLLQDFSRNNASPTFFPSPWLDPTEPPPHPYHASADGTPWTLSPQPLQRTAHSLHYTLSHDVPGFSSNYGPTMGHGVVELRPSGNASPTHGANIPDTAPCALEHTPLHNAVMGNDSDTARALLHGGADPNCAARGGMTSLHFAAYQRNAKMVKLLLDYGASLDAMTDKKRSVLFFAVRGQGQSGSSDMLAYANQTHDPHTDEDTLRVIDALFDCPTRWIRLRLSLEKADKDGVTPLMVAAGEGFHKTAAMLLQRGARPEVRDHANHTALRYAARNSHRGLVRLLLLADPAVSSERDLSHILKLASKNITTGHVHGGDRITLDSYHRPTSALIAEEMVRLCREMGVLDGLLGLAEQRRKTNVLELLRHATKQLDMKAS